MRSHPPAALTDARLSGRPTSIPPSVPVHDASDTRQRLLASAERLFHAEGFHTVGLDRVLREVGISKQGFYHHFASKEDLVLEVVHWHACWWRDESPRLLAERGGPDARRQIDALVEVMIEILENRAFRGCFFLNAIAQFPNPADPIHQAAVEAKEIIGRMLRDVAMRAGADDPVAFAREFSMIFEGAFATQALRGPEEVTPVLRRMAETLCDLRLPTGAGEPLRVR